MKNDQTFADAIEISCLEKIEAALEKEEVPSAATLDTVERLMKIVSAIESIKLNWAHQNRSYAVGSSRQASQRK